MNVPEPGQNGSTAPGYEKMGGKSLCLRRPVTGTKPFDATVAASDTQFLAFSVRPKTKLQSLVDQLLT
jgi:hypothetical protein